MMSQTGVFQESSYESTGQYNSGDNYMAMEESEEQDIMDLVVDWEDPETEMKGKSAPILV